MKYFVIFLILIGFLTSTVFGEPLDFTVAEVYWKQASFPSHDGTKATIIVTDPDMNRHPNVIDYVWIAIHSDTDHSGFRMTLFETDFDSGIFEGDVVFVEKPPSGTGFLHTVEGDTITAEYVDTLFPVNHTPTRNAIITENGIEMFSTAIVGGSSPPMERAPVSNFMVLDTEKIPIDDNLISVDQQIRLVSDLENQMDRIQPFAYLVQIQNSQNQVESLSWLTGNLTSFQKINPEVTWIPFKEGKYTATVFVWESVNNPTALSPPVNINLFVK
ncbi:hypothetical protein [Nitrosopumilus ureiphilus]|uniref:Uncharacterized protein n=1 Tax=Nitrosopumilus ureiphilus TaxID=1470067 RepID=A0A7D5M558_9ARCH|nr:hypothetical protein [Nitrosopumilus ureiphilus]QLH06675.1 hypothetical protein C5F50_05985 [Nitrosopumilus ureiphilus]